jgi:WD40 repeat protein
MLIGASGIEAVGLQQTGPRPVRSGKIQGSKADFASNYKVDGFGFFIPLQNDSKRTRPSLALSPQEARDSRARLESVQDIRTKTSSCFLTDRALLIHTKKQLILPGRNCILIWNLDQDKPLRVIARESDTTIRAAAISNSEQTVVISSDTAIIEVWDLANWQLVRSLRGHRDAVTSVAFSLNDRFLVSSGDAHDSQVVIWDLVTGTKVNSFEHTARSAVGFVGVTANGRFLLSTEYNVKKWLMRKGSI